MFIPAKSPFEALSDKTQVNYYLDMRRPRWQARQSDDTCKLAPARRGSCNPLPLNATGLVLVSIKNWNFLKRPDLDWSADRLTRILKGWDCGVGCVLHQAVELQSCSIIRSLAAKAA